MLASAAALVLAGGLEALTQFGEVFEIGLGKLLRLGLQALAPRLELAALLLRAAAFGGEHLDLLLDAADSAALRADVGLRGAQRGFEVGQRCSERFDLLHGFGGVGLRHRSLAVDRRQLGMRLALALGPLRGLRGQLGEALLHALPTVGDVADAFLETAHF
jgi:hypothetical protein